MTGRLKSLKNDILDILEKYIHIKFTDASLVKANLFFGNDLSIDKTVY